MFIKKHGSRNKNIEHYYCRRSGTYSSLGTQKRHIKVQGSCKAGSKCPASMSATCTPRGTYFILGILSVFQYIHIQSRRFSLVRHGLFHVNMRLH